MRLSLDGGFEADGIHLFVSPQVLSHSQCFTGPLGSKIETQASHQNFLDYVITRSALLRTLWVLRAGMVPDMDGLGLSRARL